MKLASFPATSQLASLTPIVLFVSVLIGCAGGSAEQVRQYAKGEALPRPPVLLVHDLTVDPADVDVDELGPNFVSGEALTSERLKEGRAVSKALSKEMVTQRAMRGITARRARGI